MVWLRGPGPPAGAAHSRGRAGAAEAAAGGRDGGGSGGSGGSGAAGAGAGGAGVLGFFAAFGERRFTLGFLYMLTFSTAMLLSNQFLAYWVQDVLGGGVGSVGGYSLLGWHLTDSAQSAVAIFTAVTAVASALATVPGGLLADRVGRRSILVLAAALQLWCPVYNGFATQFSGVLLVAAWQGACTGLLGGPIQALQADVLPAGPDGQPRNASRDVNLIMMAFVLPGIVLPMVLGDAFSWFPSRHDTYRAFFLAAAALLAVQSLFLLGVAPQDGTTTDADADKAAARARSPRGRLAAAAGLCDRLLFVSQPAPVVSPAAAQ
eukprot:SAG22_NODE_92_length_20892_cov_11.188429_7_plen_320_part_00